MILHRAKFFAASNTESGFVSYFKENFRSRADRCYIIKGGPGTGKSRLMQELGAAAEDAGGAVEYYYCSSDPSSLDGLYVELCGSPLSVIDGTSPHGEDVVLAGAGDNLIDLGRFWDQKQLYARRSDIVALTKKKNDAYTSAYRSLAAYGALTRAADALLEECVDVGAMKEDALQIARSLPREEGIPSPNSAVGMRGRVSLDGIGCNAELEILVADSRRYGISYLYFDNLFQYLGTDCRYSPHPIMRGRCDGIRVGGVAVIEAKGTERGDNVIDVADFVDREQYLAVQSRVLRLRTLADSALECALDAFENAGAAHMAVEKIYSSAMDFSAKEEYSASLCAKMSRGDL